MNEENNFKNVAKGVLKSFVKRILVIAIIVVVAMMLCGAGYYNIKKDDFKNVSDENNTYEVAVNNQGQLTYFKTNEDGTKTEVSKEEIAENLKPTLQQYVGGDDQKYEETIDSIIGAETVTTTPYIDPPSEEEEDDEQAQDYTDVQGQIKFYRYTGETEANDAFTIDGNGNETIKDQYRLTYVEPQVFESKKQEYLNGTSEEVFNYFTMDEEKNVIVAYGSREKRKVTTDDKDLTQEIIREVSGENAYTGNAKDGFEVEVQSIDIKKIDYLSLVENYTMPSNLLYALLVQTSNADFVKAIADLAYGSEIAIAIYDNQTVATEEETYSYEKIMEISGTSNYDFSKINSTSPRVDSSYLDISNVPKDCNFYTSDGSTYYHILNYHNTEDSPKETTKQENMYITEVNDAGEITKLGTQKTKTFTTKFSKTETSTSEPTVGIIFADTWIAKWKATYEKDDSGPEEPINNSGTREEKKLIEYDSTDKVLKQVSTNLKNDINNKLDTHKHEIIAETINRIVDKAVEEQKITSDDLSQNIKKTILEQHISSCTECFNQIKGWWSTLSEAQKLSDGKENNTGIKSVSKKIALALPGFIDIPNIVPPNLNNSTDFPSVDRIFEEIINATSVLRHTEVYTHFTQSMETYVNNENEKLRQNAITAKAEVEKQVVTTQTLTGDKKYTNISFTNTTTRQKTSYSKTGTIERTRDGEKFSEVFNKEEFHAAKQTFLEIESWFWEYIDENEDTAKLKNILKYLLNIATDSDDFGTFSQEDVDKLFSIFEPEVIKEFSTVGEGISKYLLQFGGSATQYTFDGVSYYKMYDDSAGNPTIGPGDIQWLSNHDRFNEIGIVRYGGEGGTTYVDCNVEQKVNELLGPDGYKTKWEGNPIEEESIYIDVETVNNATDSMQSIYMDLVIQETSSLKLSKQQIYALTYIRYSTGNLTKICGGETTTITKSFVDIYNEALSKGYEIDSPDFNKYIWENWWSIKWAGGYSAGRTYTGWLKGRDASFETYVKGTLYFDGGSVFGRQKYTYYTKEDLQKIGFSSSSSQYNGARDSSNSVEEEEIFTYEVAYGVYKPINDEYKYGIYTSSSGRTYVEWKQTTKNSYGKLQLFTDGLMGNNGCNVYGYTMLLNSAGADITPADAHKAYKSFDDMDNEGTINKLIEENNINGTLKIISLQYGGSKATTEFVTALQKGYGVLTRVGAGIYTSNGHWLVVADIRQTKLDSKTGYDIYIVTSSGKGRGWQKMETVTENQAYPYAYYIED